MANSRKYTVLLVENNEPFRRSVAGTLEWSEFRVIYCASTREALDVVGAGTSFDVVISEGRVPDGQPHGLSLARIVSARQPGTKIVLHDTMCNALSEVEIRNGRNRFVKLPVNARDRVALVAEQCHAPSGAKLG
jgi:DNA-binding NtrC family response regulator